MSERYRAGLDNLLALSADKVELVSDALAAQAPEFVRLMVEFAFADIFGRPGLDRRARLFVAIGALATQGRAPTQLRWFVRAALEEGVSRHEVVEALMEVAVFAGFASATNALEACGNLLVGQTDVGCGACPMPMVGR